MKAKPAVSIPDPADRVPVALYVELRKWLLQNDEDAAEMLNWSQHQLQPPENPERLAGEIIWIILCAGKNAQAARTIEAKVLAKLRAGKSAVEAFGYRAKAAAIDRAWNQREQDFKQYNEVRQLNSPEMMIEWLGSIPFVGDDTKFQLAKNLGATAAVVKPDIWMCRLAGIPDRPRRNVKLRFEACMALCRPISAATGDSLATIDSMLWLAANKGVLQVGADAGPIVFNKNPAKKRTIYEPAPEAVEPKSSGQLDLLQ